MKLKENIPENWLEQYTEQIRKMAHKYCRARVEYEDLVQEGLIGLLKAVEDYNPERSSDFRTYAITRIKGKMYEYCIGNNSPIYIPIHVSKAASYVNQIDRLLDKEPGISTQVGMKEEITRIRRHPGEESLPSGVGSSLDSLKQKIANIARNSKMSYETLVNMAYQSLSLIVSDEVLSKHPLPEDHIDNVTFSKEMDEKLYQVLGEKRYHILKLHLAKYSNPEIAEELFKIGYTNNKGGVMSRQAIKQTLDKTLLFLKSTQLIDDLTDDAD